MAVDLHIHSTASDGTLSPAQVVAAAAAAGLSAIAVADHDTVAGVEEALGAGRHLGVDVFPALEIGAYHAGKEVHILGYLVDVQDEDLLELLSAIRDGRRERADRIIARLQAMGVPLSLDDVLESCHGDSLGRPHVAAAMVARGFVPHAQAAFERYLRRGRPAYVPRFRPPATEAIDLILSAGGLPVIAHPGIGNAISTVNALTEVGLVGLEAYHIDHTQAKTQRLLTIAAALHLIVTGGSDSHGPGGPKPVSVGQVPVPDECAEAIRQWGRANGRWPLAAAASATRATTK